MSNVSDALGAILYLLMILTHKETQKATLHHGLVEISSTNSFTGNKLKGKMYVCAFLPVETAHRGQASPGGRGLHGSPSKSAPVVFDTTSFSKFRQMKKENTDLISCSTLWHFWGFMPGF